MRHFLIATIAATSLASATPVYAQSCPADVSHLTAQISQPQLQPMLHKSLDQIVENIGGLEAAIAQGEQKLATLQARKASLPAESSPALIAGLDEAMLVLTSQIEGLRCRREPS